MPQTAAMLDVDQLHPDPRNRPDGSGDAELEGLAATVRALGVLHPVLVVPIEGQDGQYLIRDGHRRWRAAQMAGRRQIPAMIRRSPARAGRVEGPLISVVTSFQRASLGPVELALQLGELLGEDMSQADIARYTGMSPATISYHVQLLQAGKQTLNAVRRGELTVGSVHEHIRNARGAGPGPVTGRPGRRGTTRRPRPRPYFDASNPLATEAHRICQAAGHKPATVYIYGKVACGPCWTEAIRADALNSGGRPIRPAPALSEVTRSA